MKGSSVGQKLKRNVRENNRIFTLMQRRSVWWSQERVVLYTMLDESQRDVRLDAVVEHNRGTLGAKSADAQRWEKTRFGSLNQQLSV